MAKKTNESNHNQKNDYNVKEWEQDPMILKKKGLEYFKKRDISYYKKKIIDENYMDHAIQRIAMELSHFILKDR